MNQYNKLIKTFTANDNNVVNYTRIGNPGLNIYGGKYNIPGNMIKQFYSLYKKHVFKDGNPEYITEKQLEVGKLGIDLDFRYDASVTSKQHSNDHISDMIDILLNILNDMFMGIQNRDIEIFILEKENVNQCDDKTKDGIHIIVNILCDVPTKRIIRDMLIRELSVTWDDLPITNSMNDVIDDGVIRGMSNWQLYGSKKPGNEPYKLKTFYKTMISTNDDDDCELNIEEVDVKKISFDSLFPKLCIRETDKCTGPFALTEEFKTPYEKYSIENESRSSRNALKRKKKPVFSDIETINNKEELNTMVKQFLNDNDVEYQHKEAHHYTMALPESYYGPGSYNNWIRVLWALKNTSSKLIVTWYLFCSQSSDFDFANNDALEYWNDFDAYGKDEGLTMRSISYFCKNENYEEYKKIYFTSVDYYINLSFQNPTEYDIAKSVYQMYKEDFVCSGVNTNTWHEFDGNKWKQIDSATSLRIKLSEEVNKRYKDKLIEFQSSMTAKQNNLMLADNNSNNVIDKSGDDDFGDFKKKANQMLNTCQMLKKTSCKSNIMKESRDLFYDSEFLSKLDQNPYLLGVSNGVVDFKNKSHRKGRHDDYISKTTGIPYKPLEFYKKNSPKVIEEIEEFMKQLFPDDEDEYDQDTITKANEDYPNRKSSDLRDYMMNHLASTLFGHNIDQTFAMYIGSGANGKSVLVELMSVVLGEYKGTVPISLITTKRNNIGGTSSEIYNLIGVRYAVMQEPSKGDKINEGVMKELVGGDPVQCRALFQESMVFVPQFTLAVCTNAPITVESNDDGTWRRIKQIQFKSKFTDKPYKDKRFPKKQYPYQYMIQPNIKEKFEIWAPVLLSMLVEIGFNTMGKVKDVWCVTAATQEYRKDQDIFTEFHNTYIDPTPSRNRFTIKQQDLMQKFKEWFNKFYSGQTIPNGKEVRGYFEKKYGKYPPNGWTNMSYKSEYQQQDEFM